MNKKADYQIFVTDEYSKFRKLDGNRDVTKLRVNKIKNSIQKIDYVRNPIVVNEKYEVIDGQGRLQALEELGMPVEYIIAPGTGINECREMNINMSNWKTVDYIESYAELGNVSYMYLRNLCKRFPKIGLNTILFAITGMSSSGGGIMKGEFECNPDDYESAIKSLEFVESVKPYLGKLSGSVCYFMNALIFVFREEDANNDKVVEVIRKNIDKFGDCATVEQSLEYLEKYYNKHNRGVLANFVYDYRIYIRSKSRRTADEVKTHHLRNRYGINEN